MGDSLNVVSRRVIEHPVSHMRVLGPPGSGKTRLLVERFRALEKRLRAGSIPRVRRGAAGKTGPAGEDGDRQAVFILTYSAESHQRLTEAVFDKDTARVGPPPVYTYTRLAQEIIESSRGRSPDFVADLEERLILEDVIARCENLMKSELRSICRTGRFIEDALEACHILLQNGTDGDALALMADFARTSAELSDVLLLYSEFRRAIEKAGTVTYYDVSWAAVKCLGAGAVDHPLTRAAAILVEDFQDIDAGQFELLKAIAPPGGNVALNVFGDPLGSVFSYRGTQHTYLADEFSRLYGGETFRLPARVRSGGVPDATVEALLEETLGNRAGEHLPVIHGGEDGGDGGGSGGRDNGSTGDDRGGDGGAVRDLQFEIARDELDEVWTVAARVASLLRQGACRPEEIAVISNNKTSYEPILAAAATRRGIPIDTGRERKGVFGDFIDAFLGLVETPDDEIAARSIVTSPLFPWLRGLFADERAGAEPSARDVVDLRAFVGDIRREAARAAPREWIRILAVRVLDPLAAALVRETGDDTAYQETSALLEAWESYALTIARWGGRPSIGAFAAMERRVSRRRGAAAGTVSFLSPREAKGRYFQAVFVIGCSELLFPSAARSENVLPFALLEKAARGAFPDRRLSVHRARAAAQRLCDEHHLLYIALTRSKGSLFITAPKVFAGEEYPAPSAVLLRTFPASARVETSSEEKTPPQIRFARTWVERGFADEEGEVLERLSPAGAQWHAEKPEASPVRLAPFPLSQSSMETFLRCPRLFFYRRALGIPQFEAVPAKVGLLLHEVMADLGRRFPSKTDLLARCTPEAVQASIDGAVRKDETLGKGSFYERSLRHHLAVMVDCILDLEREEPEDFEIAATEHDLEFSRGPWKFRGRIDRIDVRSGGERAIVDYKTGDLDKMAQTLRKKTLIALEDRGQANWQVPLYAWGMKAAEGSLPCAFVHLVAKAGEEPFRVTLFIRRRFEDVPPRARKGRGPSYLLESEIEEIMDQAVKVAEEMFAPRARFQKTDDTQECRRCDFARVCGRRSAK